MIVIVMLSAQIKPNVPKPIGEHFTVQVHNDPNAYFNNSPRHFQDTVSDYTFHLLRTLHEQAGTVVVQAKETYCSIMREEIQHIAYARQNARNYHLIYAFQFV